MKSSSVQVKFWIWGVTVTVVLLLKYVGKICWRKYNILIQQHKLCYIIIHQLAFSHKIWRDAVSLVSIAVNFRGIWLLKFIWWHSKIFIKSLGLGWTLMNSVSVLSYWIYKQSQMFENAKTQKPILTELINKKNYHTISR